MRKNPQKLLIIILSLFLLFSFTACSKNSKTKNNSPKSNISSNSSNDLKVTDIETSISNIPYVKYNLDLKLNEDNLIIEGNEKVTFTNNYGEDLNTIVFHLYPDCYSPYGDYANAAIEYGDITINSLSIDEKSISFSQDNEILKFQLDNPLNNGESIDFDISFDLHVPESRDRLGFYIDQYSLTNWYPIISIYNPKADSWDENPFNSIGESNYANVSDYDVTFEVPKDMVLASTGLTIDEKILDTSKIVKMEAKNVRDFVIMMSKKYNCISQEIDGIKVNSYYIQENDTDSEKSAQRMLDLAVESMHFYNENFGKYPYKEFDVVETYLSGGAMEYPQLIQMGRYTFKDEHIKNFFDEAVVHETCHQWWFSTVGNNEFEEPLLDESLTVFSTALFFEKQYGKNNEKAVSSQLGSGIYPLSVPINSSVNEFSDSREYYHAIYYNGAVLFEELRKQVGEEKFNSILKSYYKKFMFKNASVKGLLDIIEKESGKEAREFFDKAINTPNFNL